MNCNPALHTNCEVLKEVIPNTVVEALGELMLFHYFIVFGIVYEVNSNPKNSVFTSFYIVPLEALSEIRLMCDTTQHVFRFNSGDLQQVSSQAEDSSFGQSEGVCAAVQWSLSSGLSAGVQQEQHKK